MARNDVARASRITGVPAWLLAAMMGQESGGRQSAVSPAGARGVMQLMPGTARRLSQTYHINTGTRWGNLLGGAYYMKEQLTRFKSIRLALAAYNAGPGAVKDYGGVPPYAETQNYVRNIMAKRPKGGGGVNSLGAVPEDPLGMADTAAAPVQPAYTKEDAALEGLKALSEGHWSPTEGLDALRRASEATAAANQANAAMGSADLGVPAKAGKVKYTKLKGARGITFSGQKLTHDTDGLPGYPAVDIFAKPGTPFRAPEPGRVVRLSGHGGTSGQVFGWSVYFLGRSGREYFITHLQAARPKVGARLRAGQVIGYVSPWDGGAPHAHVGVHG